MPNGNFPANQCHYFWLGQEAEFLQEPLLIPVDTYEVDLTDPVCDE